MLLLLLLNRWRWRTMSPRFDSRALRDLWRQSRELHLRAHEGDIEPFFPDEDLVYAGRVHGEGYEGELAWGNFGGNARCVGFLPVGVRVGGENDEVDRGFRAQEFDDLSEASANLGFLGADIRVFEPELESDHTVATVVRDPERLESRIVVRVAEHVGILTIAVDELDGAENVSPHGGQELEDSVVLAADDESTVDKSKGGGSVFAPDLPGPDGELAVDIPESESGVLGDSRDRGMVDIEVKGNESLWTLY